MRTVLVTLALAATGCVNDYLVGEGRGGSSSSGAPGSSSSGGGSIASVDDGSSSPGTCGGDGCGDTTKADGTGSGDSVGDTGDAFMCIPCAGDAECGDDFDNCVAFDGLGALCLFACPEAGCPSGSICRDVISVERTAAMQCAPTAGTCDPVGTDDGMGTTTTGDPTMGEPTTTGAMTGESMSGGAEG